jgi:drug/metabolite transporter (DMT)-like permease
LPLTFASLAIIIKKSFLYMEFTWLIVILLAYFFFSLSYLGDKLILSGKPEPKSYTFYVSAISFFVVVFIPFIKFGLPPQNTIFWIIAEAVVYILGLYSMFSALEKFDVSRVMTTIGATQPVFIFILAWIFFGSQNMGINDAVAFAILIFGSFLISFEKGARVPREYLLTTIIASLLFSLDYVFSKIVFLHQPFLQGFIWMRICVFLFSFLILISKKNREEIFKKKTIINKKIGPIFVATHLSGGVANIFQSWAIALAPVALLPVVNSLRGVQYALLFFMTLVLSVFFPRILKEGISKKVVIQKTISIILIAIGLAIVMAY